MLDSRTASPILRPVTNRDIQDEAITMNGRIDTPVPKSPGLQ
jgi:hypothetical protein